MKLSSVMYECNISIFRRLIAKMCKIFANFVNIYIYLYIACISK